MSRLELKVPPLVLVVVTALVMGGIAWRMPGFQVGLPGRVLGSVVVAGGGLAVCLAGVLSFRRASTTVNPTRPETVSALVDSGIYRVTRNPMYLGFFGILVGWAILLSNALACVMLPAFVFYLNRFQIEPEERVLAARFGISFQTYRSRVCRWI
jgi:protein-S-isoprenylcysteine O-methyltransferase Ste14